MTGAWPTTSHTSRSSDVAWRALEGAESWDRWFSELEVDDLADLLALERCRSYDALDLELEDEVEAAEAVAELLARVDGRRASR